MAYTALSSTTVLVTGGAGFIGSNLCESLLAHGNKVRCMDNFSTGLRKNIGPFLSDPNFRLFEGDIRNVEDCRRASEGVDILLQQAALGSVPRSINDPRTTNEVNIGGFLNVLIAARDAKVKRVVYAGSSSTYGDLTDSPKVEERIGRPLSPYAVTKQVNELYAEVFGRNYGLNIVGLRYFNVFGKNQDPDGAYAAAIPRFIKALKAHESPVVFGDGSTSRDFTYVKNVVQMNHLAAVTNNSSVFGQVFNTAAGKSYTLLDMISILKRILSENDPSVTEVKIKFEAARKGDIAHSLASIEKAKRMLGYEPSYQLEAGLRETVEAFGK